MLIYFFFFVLDQEYFTLILLVYPAFSHDSNRNVQFYIEKLYLSDYVGNRGNCAIVTCKITWLQKGVELIYRTQNRAFGMTLVPSLGNNLHKWVFHKVIQNCMSLLVGTECNFSFLKNRQNTWNWMCDYFLITYWTKLQSKFRFRSDTCILTRHQNMSTSFTPQMIWLVLQTLSFSSQFKVSILWVN